MIVAVNDIVPKKLLKKGISTALYQGSIEGDKLTLTLRETRHLQGEFIARSLVTFLNFVGGLPTRQQMLFLRLVMDVIEGRDYKHVAIDGERMIFFPDPRGDAEHDVFLRFANDDKRPKRAPKSGANPPGKRPEKSEPKATTKKRRSQSG